MMRVGDGVRADRLNRRAVIVSLLIVVTVAVGFLAEVALTGRSDRPFGHTTAGHITGWVGFAVTLLVFGYSICKRWGRKPWPRRWFLVHQGAGTVGPVLLLVHSGAHVHAIVPVLALFTLWIILISGIVGQALHYYAFRTLHERRQGWLDAGVPEAEVDRRMRTEEAIEHRFRWWQYAHAPLTITFLILTALHVCGAMYFGGY